MEIISNKKESLKLHSKINKKGSKIQSQETKF